jgi:hypothetical protein
MYQLIKKYPKYKKIGCFTLIEFISDNWDIEIVEFDETNGEHLHLKSRRERK